MHTDEPRPVLLCAVARLRPWLLAGLTALVTGEALAQGALPRGFVYLRDIDPTIAQDIRYATSDNFVGRPLSGYEAGECVLRREAAAALKQVQADLRGAGLALKVYDCYRPERAVRAMAQWAADGRPGASTKRFFPRQQKDRLLALGYIAASSRHSAGTAVDLTLVDVSHAQAAGFDAKARYGPCTAPLAERAPDDGMDMGTGYDCFDVMSYTASSAVGPDHRKWRAVLVAAMARHGFKNYFREWWHFTYAGGAPPSHYDFPIPPRARKSPG